MRIKENEKLADYTTFRMGGTAQKVYFPESVEELTQFILKNPKASHFMIGGGSNLIINDQCNLDAVVCLRDFDNHIESMGEGLYYVGASVRLQDLIKRINQDGYGGIEYMYSIPGLLGGAIYMNAGRGKSFHKSISDYVESVRIFFQGEILEYAKKDCAFDYRASVFHDMEGCVILGAKLRFEVVSQEDSAVRIKERIDLCRKTQDMSAPNVGTVFCEANDRIMTGVMKKGWGYKDGCRFSSKTKNWLLNGENGTFEQVTELIRKVEQRHRLFHKNCRTEVVIWE